jgi:hypothetical protein
MVELSWTFVGFALAGCALSIYGAHIVIERDRERRRPIESLKNALLTLALMRVRSKDRDDLNTFFDGTKLPMLSGCDHTNACFSYIGGRAEFRRSPFYTKQMERKHDAIDMYLKRNLGMHEQVEDFFKAFVANLEFAGSRR